MSTTNKEELEVFYNSIINKLKVPKNHPFLQFDVTISSDNVVVFVGFKNLECNGRKFYDVYGTSTAMSVLPTVVFDHLMVSWSSAITSGDAMTSILPSHFLSDIIHRDTIQERENVVIYKNNQINWLAVANYIDLFVYKLFFLKLSVANDDNDFRLRIEQNGDYIDLSTGKPQNKFTSAILNFDKKETLTDAIKFNVLADEDATNNMLKNYVFNRFFHWVFNARIANFINFNFLQKPNWE